MPAAPGERTSRMIAVNYWKVVSPSGRTTRGEVFPFGESFESMETALASARAVAKAERGRVVVWLRVGDHPVVGEVPDPPPRVLPRIEWAP
jgi:hypothetical protein